MRPLALSIAAIAALALAGCGGSGSRGEPGDNPSISGQPVGSAPAANISQGSQAPAPRNASGAVEGQDYVILTRVRFLDEMGFDRPVEAFSMLFPKGWRTQGGVKWGSIGGCRGEIVVDQVKAASPDGKFEFQAFPLRFFQYTNDQMMLQSMQHGAQAGGCQINQPFNAQQFVEGFAKRDLQAQVSNVRADESSTARLREIDQQMNGSGGMTQRQSTMAFADVSFSDGSEGILQVLVVNMLTRHPNYMGGQPMTSSNTMAIPYLMRCPAGRREECNKLFKMFMSSHRVSPIWRSAKEQFLTQIGNMEHKASMDRIRLMGEQSRAYAEQASRASDQRMRDWENRQASSDRQQKQFVQTIREVETWRDAGGSVELSSGYSQAWSRGDGSYLLSNKPGFDPSSTFQDQAWKPMQRQD